jgi:hypothetical protein
VKTRTWLLAALAVGLLLRVGFALAQAGMYCPDEIYQYLEPAWHRLHGFGVLTWEYEVGARNWILPGWYGALMQVGEAFGLHGWKLQRFLGLHDALLSLLLIPAGFRLGRAAGDERLSVLVGCALALFPLFAYLAPHTLSDNHGLLLVTWAYALWLERRRPFLVGLLLSAAFAARYALVAFAPVVFVAQLRERRELKPMAIGFAVGLAALAAVDTLTWGGPFHSLIAFVRANGGGAQWGAAPAWYYLSDSMLRRVGPGVVVLAAAMPFGQKWRLIAGWLVPLALYSLLPHKLDRYLLAMWPLFLASGLAGLLALRDRFPSLRATVALGLVLMLMWAGAFRATLRQPMRLSAGIFRAQTDVGERADATGLLVDGAPWWSPDGEPWLKGEARPWWNGGYLLTGRPIALTVLRPELLRHRLYNYVIVGDVKWAESLVAGGDFKIAGRYEGDVTLLERAR